MSFFKNIFKKKQSNKLQPPFNQDDVRYKSCESKKYIENTLQGNDYTSIQIDLTHIEKLTQLPPEIWNYILLYINSVSDLKNISLVSKYLYWFVNEKLWSGSHAKEIRSSSVLNLLIHLPIHHLELECDKCNPSTSADWCSVLVKYKELRSLKLGRNIINKLGPKGFCALSVLQLEELDLSQDVHDRDGWAMSSSIGDSHLFEICSIVSLRKLDISENDRITDNGLICVSALVQLEILDIRGCWRVTSTGLSEVSKIPLQELYIAWGNSMGMSVARKMEYIRKINEHSTFVCGNIFSMDDDIYDDSANDQFITAISKMKTLKKLDIDFNSEITDAALSHLSQLTHLEVLRVNDHDYCPPREDSLSNWLKSLVDC